MATKIITIESKYKDGVLVGVKETTKTIDGMEKKAKSASNGIAAGFLKAELAMKGVRMAFKLAGDSMKAFADATGDKTLETFNSQIKTIQAQIGAGLTPEIAKFTKFFEENSTFILQAVRTVTEGFLGLKDIVVGVFKVVGNAIFVFDEFILSKITGAIAGVVGAINKIVQAIPDNFIPKKWKTGMDDMARSTAGFNTVVREDMKATAATVAEGAGDIVKGMQRIGNASKVDIKIVTDYKKPASKEDQSKADAARVETAAKEKAAKEEAIKTDSEKFIDKVRLQIQFNNNQKAMLDTSAAYEEDYYAKIQASIDKSVAQKKAALEEQFLVVKSNSERALELANSTAYSELTIAKESAGDNLDVLDALNSEYSTGLEKRALDTGLAIQKAEKAKNDAIAALDSKFLKDRATFEGTMLLASMNARDKSFQAQRDALQETLDKQLEALKKYYADGVIPTEQEYMAALLTLKQEHSDSLATIDNNEKKARYSAISEVADFYVAVNDKIMATARQITEARMELVDAETEEQKTALRTQILNERDYDKAITKLDKEAADKKKKIQKDQMLVNIAMAIADTAQAFIKSMAQWGMPLGAIFGGLAAAAGAVNIGIMISQMQKMAKGGIVGGDAATGDSQQTMLTPGEVVLNQKQQANTLMAIANGKQQSAPTAITGGATTVIIQGNASRADIDGALTVNRQKQMTDMRSLLKEMQYAGMVRMQVA